MRNICSISSMSVLSVHRRIGAHAKTSDFAALIMSIAFSYTPGRLTIRSWVLAMPSRWMFTDSRLCGLSFLNRRSRRIPFVPEINVAFAFDDAFDQLDDLGVDGRFTAAD